MKAVLFILLVNSKIFRHMEMGFYLYPCLGSINARYGPTRIKNNFPKFPFNNAFQKGR